MSERPLTKNIIGFDGHTDLTRYEANGGYQAVRGTIGRAEVGEILEVIKESNLRGRGGAGFPTGMKWSFVPAKKDDEGHRYLVANADEMEPGTFKDRLILERDPHQLIEGMILSAYTIEADVGYIFVRAEYHVAIARLREAIAAAEGANLLGDNILQSGYNFKLHVHVSAGAISVERKPPYSTPWKVSAPLREQSHLSRRSAGCGGGPLLLITSKLSVTLPTSLLMEQIG